MTGASRLQVWFRAVAAITAVWFLACGVLAARHEATTVHVRDGAGGYTHARLLTGKHAGHRSDIHGQRNPDADTGECALLTASHQAASAHVTPPAVVTTACATDVPDAPRTATLVATCAVYRLAPKTSPPAVA